MRISSSAWAGFLAIAMATPLLAQQPAGQGRTGGRGGRGPMIDEPGAMVDIVAKPVRNGQPDVQYLEVRQTFRRAPGATDTSFTIRGPNGPPTGPAPEGLEIMELTDANGPVPMTNERGWRATRTVTFPVTATYKARMWGPGTRTNPSPMLRSTEGSVSGQGSGMFLFPGDGINYHAKFRWDLSDLAPGSIFSSGLGEDSVIVAPLQTLSGNYFMAGPLHRYPATGDRDGFAAFWHGTPSWDADKVMETTARIYEDMRKLHRDVGPRRYRVFGRMLPPPAYGGTAPLNQFMFNAPAGPRDTADKGPLMLLAHETGHLFVRGLQDRGTNWFSEGLNEYYAERIALASGYIPIDVVHRQMSVKTANYYNSPRRTMPADSVARASPMTDGIAQNISYERGQVFWADMDARIRAFTNNKLNLDSVLVPMMARGRGAPPNGAGAQPFTTEELVAALEKAAGPGTREHFNAVLIRGEMFVPRSDSWGPCFRLKAVKLPDQWKESGPFGEDGQLRPGNTDGYIWERVPGVPDTRCRHW